jgi:hypothetical protein
MHCWGSKEPRAVIADLLLLPHAIFDLGETTRLVSYMKVSHLSPSGCHAGRALLCRLQTMLPVVWYNCMSLAFFGLTRTRRRFRYEFPSFRGPHYSLLDAVRNALLVPVAARCYT